MFFEVLIGVSPNRFGRNLTCDKPGAKLYAQNFDKQLLVFSVGGVQEKTYQLSRSGQIGNDVRQLLAYPRGHRVLILTGNDLFWVELPGAIAADKPIVVAKTNVEAGPVIAEPGANPDIRPRRPIIPRPPRQPRTAEPAPVPSVPRVSNSTAMTGSIRFDMNVDGKDLLHIQGDSVWITHRDWSVPGQIHINGKEWAPQWKDNVSTKWIGLVPPVPVGGLLEMSLKVEKAGGPITIFQQPKAENAYETVLVLDDNVPFGAHPFAFTLNWRLAPIQP